jgi:7-hydroxymethyl chlorophyll a reductase
LAFAKYSIDYHYLRNWLYVQRHMGESRAERHVPEFAKKILAEYDGQGEISARLNLKPKDGRWK